MAHQKKESPTVIVLGIIVLAAIVTAIDYFVPKIVHLFFN